MKNKQNNRLKFIFLIIIVSAIVYIFQNYMVDIYIQLKKLSLKGCISILILSIGYSFVEGFNISFLAKQFSRKFTILNGIGCSFYTSFYKTATFGSGSYVASVYYLQQKGISPSQGVGVSTLNYVFHRLSIALFSIICIIINYSFIKINFYDYLGIIKFVYIITILILFFLVSICLSNKFHKFLLLIIRYISNKLKINSKYKEKINYIEAEILRIKKSSIVLLKNKMIIVIEILMNLVKFLLIYLSSYIALREMNINIAIIDALTVTSLAMILAGSIPAPAGIASVEFVYTLLFSVIANSIKSVSSMLIYRFSSFIVPFLVGGLYVILRKVKRSIFYKNKEL